MISGGEGEETAALAEPGSPGIIPRGRTWRSRQAYRHPAQGGWSWTGRPPRRRSGPRRAHSGEWVAPRFAEEEFGLTPAQKGVALHLVMQYIDFSKAPPGGAQVAREVERLVREEYLTPEQGKAVDPARLAAFFASPLGREACASPTLRREFKFSILVPAGTTGRRPGRGRGPAPGRGGLLL